MREDWTLERYVEELRSLANLEFSDSVHPEIITMKSKMLLREMHERFTPEEFFAYGIVFEKSV